MACILLWSSAVRVNDSHVYRKMDVTREHIRCILELREIFLSFQTGFNLVKPEQVLDKDNTPSLLFETHKDSFEYWVGAKQNSRNAWDNMRHSMS